MKKCAIVLIILFLLLGIAIGAVLAKHHTPEERGKTLFTTAGFAGGEKSCNECHPDGSGLAMAGSKQDFGKMGKTLEDAINFCIEFAIKGKPIAKGSDEMKDIAAYVRSVGAAK